MDLAAQVLRWLAGGQRVALATVVDVIRSAPRPPGAKLAVSTTGETCGAVSGGCVEGAVITSCHALLERGGPPRMLRFGIDDDEALGVGLPCGGEIDVLVELVGGRELTEFLGASADREVSSLLTALEGGAKLLVRGDGSRGGTLGSPELDAAAIALSDTRQAERRAGTSSLLGQPVFCDLSAAAPRLLLFGAVDYSAALCRLAAESGWSPFVIEPRHGFAASGRFAAAERVLTDWPREAIDELGGIDETAAVVVLTHDPKLDDEALSAALESPARYIGAMGSRVSCERRNQRLCEAGFSVEDLARISAPVGLDIGASSPAETALSIFAEIVAVTNGRRGGRLTEADGPIHVPA